jgi:tetratricopeptide (TPR) repeat protein
MRAAGKEKISAWIWASLAALVLLALAVIFVLPGVVQQYELPLAPRVQAPAPNVAVAPATNTPAGPAISPFQEAQIARQRREAQDALASLLQRQADLDATTVTAWAQDAYNAAIESARLGDEAYRNANFADATIAYQQSDLALSELQAQRPAEFQRLIREGEAALLASDANTALARFNLAALIDPSSVDADNGVRRAQVLNEVESLLEEGEVQQRAGNLAEANMLFEQAQALDRSHPRIDTLIAENAQLQIDANFTSAMSEGFAQLQQSQSDSAIAAFERALQIKPGDQQAQQAIAQTQTQLTLDSIAEQRQLALTLEAAEQWQPAIVAYDALLALDPNLVLAQEGRDYSQRRLQLDLLLETNLTNPLRLTDSAALQEAQEVFRIASDLAGDLQQNEQMTLGARLRSQIERTDQLLQQMQIPVQLTVISDNATEVTIYQVGQLGTFSETSIELMPGRYVAVGTRPGFRDVREEFVVGFGQPLASLTITCNEQVAAENRR